MKIVVFGPFKRTGALRGEGVVDLSYAYAKYLQEQTGEPNPLEMADVAEIIGVFVTPPGTSTLTVTPVPSRSFAIIALSASSAALEGP